MGENSTGHAEARGPTRRDSAAGRYRILSQTWDCLAQKATKTAQKELKGSGRWHGPLPIAFTIAETGALPERGQYHARPEVHHAFGAPVRAVERARGRAPVRRPNVQVAGFARRVKHGQIRKPAAATLPRSGWAEQEPPLGAHSGMAADFG